MKGYTIVMLICMDCPKHDVLGIHSFTVYHKFVPFLLLSSVPLDEYV